MINRTAERVPTTVYLIGLAVVGLIVRVAIAAHGGFWRDEALFLFVTKAPSWGAMLDFLRMHESHPPLFFALMRVWISIVGDTDARSMVLPVAFGVALVPAAYYAGRSLFSERTGLLAATLTAFSPALSEYSAVARPYSLMPLLTLLSTYTLIRGLHGGGRRIWAGYCLSTLALLYTHNWGWLVLCGEWAAVLMLLASGAIRSRGRVAREWLLVQLAIGIGYLPWASTLLFQARHAGHAPSELDLRSDLIVWLGSSARELIQATILGYFSLDDAAGYPSLKPWLFALPLIILAADQYLRARNAAASSSGKNEIGEDRIALTCLLVIPASAWFAALVLSRSSELMLPRCLVMLAPLLLLALACWLERPRHGVMLVLSRAAIVAFIATYAVSLYDLARTTRSNARELAAAVGARTQPSDLVIVAPEWLASSFNRYYSPAVDQIDYPHIGREGAIDFTGMLERFRDDAAATRVRERIADARREGRRGWLIVDREKLFIQSPAAIGRLLESPNYILVATARTSQLRADMDSLYGPPDTSTIARGLPPRYENLRAFLYAPSDTARRTVR